MPYRWNEEQTELILWPHRSMTNGGFVVFMSATAILLSIPLFAVLGSPVLWALLPFMAIAVGGLWLALSRNDKDASLSEILTFSADRIHLIRNNPRHPDQTWEANPYWVTLHLHKGDKPVENYLTLKGSGREVELGAFLSPDERVELHQELCQRLGG